MQGIHVGDAQSMPAEDVVSPAVDRFARLVMESTSDGILVADADGRGEYVNPAGQQLLGWSNTEIAGHDVHALLHATCAEPRCVLRRPFFDALTVRSEEDVLSTRWGHQVPVDIRVSPEIVDGEVTGIVCVFSDATDQIRRRRAQAEALAAKEAAVAELAELGRQRTDFVLTVSHELRTPLTSIMGFLDIALEDAALSEQTRDSLQVVERNARRLLAQVEALLLVSRIEAGKIQANITPTSLDELIRDAVRSITPEANGKNVSVSAPVSCDLVVEADPTQIDRVLLNLLSNAVKFTPAGGQVDVSVTSSERLVQVTVRDTGMGIPADEQGKLFEKFFRSSISQRRATPGTGLGLAIVKAIIEEHGGRVAVTSREGVGTAVAFTLRRSSTRI